MIRIMNKGKKAKQLKVKLIDIQTSVEFNKNRDLVDRYIPMKDKDDQFLAPEILSGDNVVADQRCDLWSVGVIMVFMLTGKLPFNANHYEQLIKNM